jgi:hypothetical protein
MKRLAPASLLLVLAAASSTAACAPGCSATAPKLAALQRGMSYEEATGVMGCSGTQVTRNAPDTAEVSTVEWSGPERGMVSRTQLDFRDGKLLSFTTGNRGGW